MSDVVIVLVMHGAPPNDFPKHELAELFGLHMRLDMTVGPERAALERRHAELESKVRSWPRTSTNDPFYAGSLDLAHHLGQETGLEVILGFNEFCAPSVDEALEQAVRDDVAKVIVVTPMMTAGGEHSEKDIPNAIERLHQRHPHVKIIYSWPFPLNRVAQFLASQIAPHLDTEVSYGP